MGRNLSIGILNLWKFDFVFIGFPGLFIFAEEIKFSRNKSYYKPPNGSAGIAEIICPCMILLFTFKLIRQQVLPEIENLY